MFIHYRTEAIVFGEEESGEADQIFIVFTKKFGKLEILGKATRKLNSKLRASIPLFSLCDIEFIQAKTHKTLTDSFLIKDFNRIKKNLGKLKIAFKIAEVLEETIKGQERDPRIWRLLLISLSVLNDFSLRLEKCLMIYHYFLWNLFSILGYEPDLRQCLICEKILEPKKLYFHKEGGVICAECYKKEKSKSLEIDPDIVKVLREIKKKDLARLMRLKIEKEKQKPLVDISEFYLSHLLSQLSF